MINLQDRTEACGIVDTAHGSWCWECFEEWGGCKDQNPPPSCSNCEGTLRDPIPWCELFVGGRK